MPRSKAIATLEFDIDDNEGIQSYEYRIVKLASGVMMYIEPPLDSIKNTLESGGLLEEAIGAYDLVSKIGRDLVGLESNTILAQDRHFLRHLDENHHNFESGYQYLTQLRRNL